MPLKPEVLAAWPPQGWIYFQPQTNWWAPAPLQNNFAQQVNNIIKMRRANPQFKMATDFKTVAQDLERYTEKRIKSNPKFCVGEEAVLAQKKSPASLRSPLLRAAAAVASGVIRVDPKALEAWLGAGGKPVPRELAERRAEICSVCPANSSSPNCPENLRHTWRDWVTAPVADWLRRYLGYKHAMELSTSHDAGLGKCLACRCELELKVHAPLEHIRANLEEDALVELRKYPDCWVLRE